MNYELIIVMAVYLLVSYLFTMKWKDAKAVRRFFLLLGAGYIIVFQVIVPLIFKSL